MNVVTPQFFFLSMPIRALDRTDALSFQSLRLSGLKETPSCFASSYEDEKNGTPDEFAGRLTATEDRVVLGAFAHDRLVGIAGVRRDSLRKYRHKAGLWGVYVDPDSRGTGVSKLLVTEAIRFAMNMPGVTQLNLTVTASNTAAVRLYQSLGFNEFGRESGSIFADGELHDEFHMCLHFSMS